MKYISFYFSCLVIILIWSCNKEADFEYPVTPDFDGKFVFAYDVSRLGTGHVGFELFSFDKIGSEQLTMSCINYSCQTGQSEWIFPGDKIVYHLHGVYGMEGYYLIDKDGNNNHLLIKDDTSSNRYTSDATEDGKLFSCFSHEQLRIFQFDADTLKIIDSVAWVGDGSVEFSPNDESVVIFNYSPFTGLKMGIHQIGQPGIIPFSMTGQDLTTDEPNFSYQSDKIVFLYDGDIWVINSDGTDPQKIINTSKDLELTPAWSPVEDCIAFSRQPFKHPNEPSELVLFNFASKTESVILSTKDINLIDDIKWSADGQQIAFHNHNEKETNLGTFIINKDGTGLKRISKVQYPYDDWFTE